MDALAPLPRLLAIMGSGETSPTMVKTHREMLGRLGPPPVPAVVLDTPYGFQANAADLAARAVEYFRESVGHTIEVAHFLAADGDPLGYETMLAQLRSARYVFSGPGSPTYALRQWQATLVPKMLAEKLHSGGCVTFASAAALTLGVATVPVYEIYKAGEDPRWLDGLDLLGEVGIRAAVIPHYNNAEGGTHDTRFCYLGERRLALLERELPDDAFVLGVDEHTAVVFDLDTGLASVTGLGAVTVRRRGMSTEIPSGKTLALADLLAIAAGDTTKPSRSDVPAVAGEDSPPAPATGVSPLLANVARLESAFDDALAEGDVDEAVRSLLALEDELVSWTRDTLQSDELDQGRAALRAMVVRLGETARRGVGDPAEVVGPFVEALLAQRVAARAAKRWDDADVLRDTLVGLGVEVQDSPEGTTWRLLP